MPQPFDVLLVDRESSHSQSVRAAFAAAGIRLQWADTNDTARTLLASGPVAVAILADEPAPLDAHELADHLRSSPIHRGTSIVFLDNAGLADLPPYPSDRGAVVDVMNRHVAPALLVNRARLILDLHRQRVQLAERTAQLERSSRLNAWMIGALVHDIRTPLSVLAMNAELVSRRAEVPAVQQAGLRMKSATSMLSRHVEHLVNLADGPGADLRVTPSRVDLAELVRQRVGDATDQALLGSAVGVEVEGRTDVPIDAALMSRAIDHLLLLAASHGDGQALRVRVDGTARRTVLVRISVDAVLQDDARQHLFGAGESATDASGSTAGDGMLLADRIVRAHGGSLIGRSREGEGTVIEMLLAREPA